MDQGHPLPLRSDAFDLAEARPRGLATLGLVGIGLAGLVLGLSATALTLDRGWDPGRKAFGPWRRQVAVENAGSDPYAQARFATTGEIPMPENEGLVFTAETDDGGFQLLRRCRYAVAGPLSKARVWSLTVEDAEGRPFDNPARRFGFTSSTVIRDLSGGFAVVLSSEAQPGNWLPTPGSGPMILVLRLYDTPLSGQGGGTPATLLPTIERRDCATS